MTPRMEGQKSLMEKADEEEGLYACQNGKMEESNGED